MLIENKYEGSNLFLYSLTDARYYFGCLHIASVILSFVSIWTSSVIFNDVENAQSYQGSKDLYYTLELIDTYVKSPWRIMSLLSRFI